MDLRNFRESTRPAAAKASYLERTYTRVRYWLLPPTVDKRTERLGQYKDLAIFVGVIGVVSYFQENISKLLEIDTDAARSLM
jgi:hypothetical protein